MKLIRRVLLVLVLTAALAPLPAAANTRAELAEARNRLSELERRITSQEAAVDRLNARMRDLAISLIDQQDQHAAVRHELRRTQARLAASQTDLDELRQRMRSRARAIYMHGSGGWFDAVLRATSIRELGIRVQHVGRFIQRDAELVDAVQQRTDELAADEAQRDLLLQQEASGLRTVTREHRVLESSFAQQQELLADLARTRVEAQQTVDELRDKLASEVGPLERAAGRGTPISFGEWAEHFLHALGAPVVRNNLVVVVAWQQSEYTRATWNPLATSYSMPGATIFNSHGVKNFTSLEQGIEASIRTLRISRHGYDPIVAGLMAGADPMVTGRAINASNWCRGCTNGQYMIGIIPTVDANFERFAAR